MDTCLVAVLLRYLIGNRSHLITTVSVQGPVQVAFDVVGNQCFLDENVYILTFRDLQWSCIVDLGPFTVYAFHSSHPLAMIILSHRRG